MVGTLTRRAVLGGSAGALAVGSGAWSVAPGGPAEGLRVLGAAEAAVIDALSDCFFPGVHFPLSGSEAGVRAEVDRIVADCMDPIHAAGFRAVLRALDLGTAASRGRRFVDLTRAEQLDVLETWTEPEVLPRRVAGESLKAVLGMAYFAHPEIRSAMGWRSHCVGEAS